MFHVHGLQGRVCSGTLEQLRLQRPVAGASLLRALATDPPLDLWG